MSTLPEETANTQRNWVASIESLFQAVTEWAQENRWQIGHSEKDVTEERFETYRVPVLLLSIPGDDRGPNRSRTPSR